LDGDVRCVVVIDGFGGLTPAALWHDLTMGLGNLRAWKRIALVTDVTWMALAAATFGWGGAGRRKRFSPADPAPAIALVARSRDAPSPTATEASAPAEGV